MQDNNQNNTPTPVETNIPDLSNDTFIIKQLEHAVNSLKKNPPASFTTLDLNEDPFIKKKVERAINNLTQHPPSHNTNSLK